MTTITTPGDDLMTGAQGSLLDPDGSDRGRKPRQPTRPRCALCPALPASDFGLCIGHLQEAAGELARLAARPVPDPRPSSVPFSSLCGRCGSHRHDTAGCRA